MLEVDHHYAWLAIGALILIADRARAEERERPPRLEGIDVSNWQGEIDWRRVARAGIEFAFIRASDGVDTPHEWFAVNFRGGRRSGLRRGAYQYFGAGQDASRLDPDARQGCVQAVNGSVTSFATAW